MYKHLFDLQYLRALVLGSSCGIFESGIRKILVISLPSTNSSTSFRFWAASGTHACVPKPAILEAIVQPDAHCPERTMKGPRYGITYDFYKDKSGP